MRSGLIASLLILCPFLLFAQPSPPPPPPPDTGMTGALNLFVDCFSCDGEFLVSELGFVNFVRDRHLADVHLLVSTQITGANGREFMLEFIGANQYSGMRDTLKFVSPPNESDDAIRKGLAKTIKMGLVRFVSRTPQAKDLNISYSKPSTQAETRDKWNYWVFNVNLQSSFNGEASYKYFQFYTDISANRVTEQLKIMLDVWSNYSERRYPDDMYLSRSLGINGGIAPSLTDHWSIGASFDLYANTYSNVRGSATFGPMLEYDIYPYKESSRRMFRIGYGLNFRYYDYVERTIYEKDSEWLMKHYLEADISATQPWGRISTSVTFSNYLHDFSKNRVSLYGDVSFNLVSGLQLSLSGGYTRLYDQFTLAAGGVTEQQQLLRLRELATSYDYWGSFGFQYTFGSKYNNVVNRRFGW
jgi:hypothetical protein